MKKIIFTILSLGMALSAYAQSAELSSTAGSNANIGDPKPYNKVMVTYSPLSLKEKNLGTFETRERDGGYNSLGLTYMRGSLLARFPLYLEYGCGVQYMFKHKVNSDIKVDLLSLNVPVNVLYRFAFNEGKQHLAPYTGFYWRCNVRGKDGDDSLLGEDGYMKRFQLGWQVGLQYDVSKFYIHLAYLTDITNCSKKFSSEDASDPRSLFGGFNFGVGVVF